MVYQLLLEQRGRLTKGQRSAFIRQINSLISKTGKLEREKVERMVDLLARVKSDLQDRMLGLPKGNFTRATAEQLKREIERQLASFRQLAQRELLAGQLEFSALAKQYTDVLVRSQAQVPSSLEISPQLIENAATRSADLITSLTTRQVGRASDAINRAVLSGKSVFEVARDLSQEFNKGLAQMETIARTEMLGIYSQVQAAQFDELDLTVKGLKKQWIAVVDQRTRESHLAVHLVSIPNDETWQVGDAEFRFPRDPAADAPAESIGCRCTMVPDFSGVSEEASISAQELPPVSAPLGGLARKVATAVRKADL